MNKKYQEYINVINKRYSHLNIIKIKEVPLKKEYIGVLVTDYGSSVMAYKTKHTLYIAFIDDGSCIIMNDRDYGVPSWGGPCQYGRGDKRRYLNVKTKTFTSQAIEDIFNA